MSKQTETDEQHAVNKVYVIAGLLIIGGYIGAAIWKKGYAKGVFEGARITINWCAETFPDTQLKEHVRHWNMPGLIVDQCGKIKIF